MKNNVIVPSYRKTREKFFFSEWRKTFLEVRDEVVTLQLYITYTSDNSHILTTQNSHILDNTASTLANTKIYKTKIYNIRRSDGQSCDQYSQTIFRQESNKSMLLYSSTLNNV